MKLHRTAFVLALTLTTTASASDSTELEKLTTKLAYLLDGQPFGQKDWTSTVSQMNDLDPPSACYAAVKASGLTAGAKVYASQAFRLPNVQKDDQGYYVTVADVTSLCKRYEQTYIHEYVEAALVESWQDQIAMKQPVEGQFEVEAKNIGVRGAECAKRVDAALASGLAASEPIASPRYEMPAIELGAAKATYCQPAIDFGGKRAGDIAALAQSKQDAIVAVYKKAGIKGQRLELFVSYGMPDGAGFYAAGCQREVTSVKELKTAKKLFVWLESDAGYTIRKYAFKGDRYVVSEKQFVSQAGAYGGCR